ncbi:winged helix-turn-helix domain-containing protein [Glutamicibacter protophormiae]|uniref:Sensory transduction protein regX3 n=1 Tax=Kocuria varians TaxID=1272 RepID=A0A7D7KYI4_KOCVA|nr:winged helix-turn-helix domain-containing protein [Kocuria varians]QMS55687.1 Sensory transduction protein regX3 [Kocuria varians]WNB88806.1 winged helix-turn-helix domain-containing protein [Glutamicibacter protophormiae]
MTGAPGYVHISQRHRVGGAQAPVLPRGAHPVPATPEKYRHLRSVSADFSSETRSGAQPVAEQQPTEARGFVLYVGVDEQAAADRGINLVQLVQDIRQYISATVPESDSYAAVALAPINAEGTDLEVVRSALGDPTFTDPVIEPIAPLPASGGGSTIDHQRVGVLIDLSRREVFLDGELLNLTHREFELLNYLVENGTRTVGRTELLDNLWEDADEVPSERTIDVHVRRLRSKLGRLANTVRTVRGQGYRFYDHPEVVVWAAPEYSI